MIRSRTLPAWLAILAMALQALWPLIAQAKPFDPLQSAVICSAAGMALPAGGDVPSGGDRALEHCKLCVSGSHQLSLAPSLALAPFQAAPVSAMRIAHRSPVISSSPLYSPAHSRAPPALPL